jgi:serine/threonine-protein kinase
MPPPGDDSSSQNGDGTRFGDATEREHPFPVGELVTAQRSEGTVDLKGELLAHFRILDRLGRGGMGVVYRARDEKLGRIVALKVLPASVAGESERRARFLREARAAAAVNHPNIATVYDLGDAGGRVYLAMELVEGETLRRRLKAGALPRAEAIRIARAMAEGLAVAHEKGIVHRDLKPENVMIARDGGVKILDFGLAKLREPLSTDSALAQQETETLEGRVMGTPGYMSPEQASGRPCDARTDVYAMGVVIHEMLTGGIPGVGAGRNAIRDSRLEAIVVRCLAAAPEERWADAGRLLEGLAKVPGHPRRALRLVALASLGVGVVVGISMFRNAHAPVRPAAAPAASTAATPSATTYTSQPPPATGVAEARSEYAAGLQALRDDSWELAGEHFRRAVQLDPSMAAAHMRAAINAPYDDPETGRTEFRQAMSMRAGLSERDRTFLDAVEPIVGRAHKDRALAGQRLEAASERWPLDVEILDWIAGFDTGSSQRVLDASRRASELDPQDAQALENLGYVLAVLGREDESRQTFERAVAVARNSGDILYALTYLDGAQGRCADMERDARRFVDVEQPFGSAALLCANAALRRPEATLRELAQQHAGAWPEPLREMYRVEDEASIAFQAGRFDAVRSAVDRFAGLVAANATTSYSMHLWEARTRALLAVETGDLAEARRVAKDFVSRRDAWTEGLHPHGLGRVDSTPWLARLAAGQAGTIDAFRSAWIDEQAHDGALAGLLWSFGWAGTAQTRKEALDALGARTDDARLQSPAGGTCIGATMFGIPDAYTGRVYLLAGRPGDAVPPLRRAAGVCACGPHLLADHVHAQLDLAVALERVGDAKGACDAFGDVVALWGKATPRSASAELARQGLKRLRCAAQ